MKNKLSQMSNAEIMSILSNLLVVTTAGLKWKHEEKPLNSKESIWRVNIGDTQFRIYKDPSGAGVHPSSNKRRVDFGIKDGDGIESQYFLSEGQDAPIYMLIDQLFMLVEPSTAYTYFSKLTEPLEKRKTGLQPC